MSGKEKYLLVDKKILPDVFEKVIQVKKSLDSGEFTSVNDATKNIGISRTAFYKYKDHVFPFYETSKGKVITLYLSVEDSLGILSAIINAISKINGNILTINQNIPINGLADVTVSIDTSSITGEIDYLLCTISEITGVRKTKILSRG